jgi:hypothetical protein
MKAKLDNEEQHPAEFSYETKGKRSTLRVDGDTGTLIDTQTIRKILQYSPLFIFASIHEALWFELA